jgi:putative ABC transport system ATP-binding protein
MNNTRGIGARDAGPAAPLSGTAETDPLGRSSGVGRASPPSPFEAEQAATLTRSAAASSRCAIPGIDPRPSSRFANMLVAQNLTKEYASGTGALAVLRDVSFTITDGELVSIIGPSGSGKTTLLGLLAGLDTPSRGAVLLDGTDLARLDEDARAKVRGAKVGFVFQSFQLIPTLTALENVTAPLELRGDVPTKVAIARATELLTRVGLAGRHTHFPTQLSGGEQQRVAIARAFVNEPKILFADEPTGNLDGSTGARIVELLEELNRERGSTVVLVTHDQALAARTQRTIRLKDGLVVEDRRNAPMRAEPNDVAASDAPAAA